MEYKDYYQTLGVSRDSKADDIKKAFRKLARKYHPDVSQERDAEQRMKELNEAYAVLSDPDKRAAYDQLGRAYRPGQEFRPPPDWNPGFDFTSRDFTPHDTAGFSDFFSELFGRFGAQRGYHARGGRDPPRARGRDHQAVVELDIADAFTGAVREVSLRAPRMGPDGRIQLESRKLNVKIPKGVCAGQVVRLAGQGLPGANAGPAGDLLLEVRFRPHPRLRAEGRNVALTLPVTPWEAALGAVVPVDLPGGPVKVRIPEGAQSGMQLRVRGKGIPGEPPGDLLLEIRVVLPQANTARARELYETMARDLDFDPRREGTE